MSVARGAVWAPEDVFHPARAHDVTAVVQPTAPVAEADYNGELMEAHYAALRSALAALAGKERNPSGIGRHPLGCSEMRYPHMVD
jgi:hypothetical protein